MWDLLQKILFGLPFAISPNTGCCWPFVVIAFWAQTWGGSVAGSWQAEEQPENHICARTASSPSFKSMDKSC